MGQMRGLYQRLIKKLVENLTILVFILDFLVFRSELSVHWTLEFKCIGS